MISRRETGLLGAAMALLLCSASIPGVAGAVPASSNLSYPHQLAFIWYFGYLGDEFQPQAELGVSQQQMISEAGIISSSLGGKGNVVLVHAIAESAQKEITTGMLPVMRGYVSSLHQSAKYVSGWLDLKFTNTTSPSNIYTQVNMMVNEIGVNAIWFDHAVDYYNSVNSPAFNQMMETLHQMFPSVLFFLNVSNHKGDIKPMKAYPDWAPMTYVFPTEIYGMALDASASQAVNGSQISVAATLSTVNYNDLIVAYVSPSDTGSNSPPAVVGITGGGLTWHHRVTTSVQASGNFSQDLEEWYAVSPSPLNNTVITATLSAPATAETWINVLGISGADTTSPFDTNPSLPATAQAQDNVSTTMSTTRDTDMLLYACAPLNGPSTGNFPHGWTPIANESSLLDQREYSAYQIVTSAQSGLVTSCGGSGTFGVEITDAVQSVKSAFHAEGTVFEYSESGHFPGRVVIHFDSQADNPKESMGIFASLNAKQEIAAIRAALETGLQPGAEKKGYNVLVPMVGANTYSYSGSEGTIYNGLTVGLDARGTAGSFLQAMHQYFR